MNQQAKSSVSDIVTDLPKLLVPLLVPLLVLAPAIFLDGVRSWLQGVFAESPWLFLWIIIPAVLGRWALQKSAKGSRDIEFRGRFFIFFVVFVILFGLSAEGRFFDSKRIPVGFEDTADRNWMSLIRAGDWRYAIARRPPRSPQLHVVTLPPRETLEQRRMDIARAVTSVVHCGAEGIALDFYFESMSHPGVDAMFCAAMETARDSIPTFHGYQIEEKDGDIIPRTMKSIPGCLRNENRRHLAGFRDGDGRIRSIPLFLEDASNQPALSLALASAIPGHAQTEISERPGLLQFLPPDPEIVPIPIDSLLRNDIYQRKINGGYVLIGEDSERDSFATPFGRHPGVLIHAMATNALITGGHVKRGPRWPSLFMFIAVCYAITLLIARGVQTSTVLLVNLGVSLVVFGISAAAMYWGAAWLDVIYVLLPMWLLTVMLLVLRRHSSRAATQ